MELINYIKGSYKKEKQLFSETFRPVWGGGDEKTIPGTNIFF